MSGWLKKNLTELIKEDRELASQLEQILVSPVARIVYSRQGLPVTKIGTITLHSLVDPEAEAGEWVRRAEAAGLLKGQPKVGVWGFGTGYHIKALLKTGGLSIAVFEPSLDVLRLAFEVADFAHYLPRISWVVDREQIPRFRHLPLLRHQPSVRFHKTSYSLWLEALSSPETMRGLKEAFRKDEAISSFFEQFPPDAPADLGMLAEGIRQGTGPPADWQIIFLLMEELGKLSRKRRGCRDRREGVWGSGVQGVQGKIGK